MPTRIVLSGIPGSGKTTLGRKIAEALTYSFIDKDDILEALFCDSEVRTLDDRRHLSRKADDLLRAQVRESTDCVVCSWWRHPAASTESGTESSWLLEPGLLLTEIHCWCRAEVAAQRFLARSRHASHMDARWSQQSLLEWISQYEAFGPIFPRRAYVVDSENVIDVAELLAWLEAQQVAYSAA